MFDIDEHDNERWGDNEEPQEDSYVEGVVTPELHSFSASSDSESVSSDPRETEGEEESAIDPGDDLIVGEPIQVLTPQSETAESDAEGSEVGTEMGAEVEEVEQKKSGDKPEKKEPTVRELTPEQEKLPWYVVHTYSGFEQYAKRSLEERIKLKGLNPQFGNILIPQETVVELVRGKKKTSTRKYFPGYILVQLDLNDDTWHLVKDTPKVTGFVGDSKNPVPISEEEVRNLVQQLEGGALKPRPKVQFEEGDPVKVVDGPFADFNGTVDEVRPDKGKVRVLISIFGRNTPVELDFVQVEKA